MTPVPETPIQKKDCNVSECKRAPNGFKTSRGLTNHLKKFHDIVLDAFSPAASSAKILFQTRSETPSIQGNSKGQVNFPKRLSEGLIICGKCPQEFSSRDEVKKHMDNKHDKEEVINDEIQMVQQNEEEILVNFMEDIEDGNIARNLENRIAVEKIVQNFVEIAYNEMNPSEVTIKPSCHECACKDEKIIEFEKLLDEKDSQLVEKSVTIKGMGETLRKNVKERTEMQKKVDQTDKINGKLVETQKEIAVLKVRLETREAMSELNKQIAQNETNHVVTDKIEITADIKKCKKCKFTASNLKILGLHMENDHQHEFMCTDCTTKFPFKNQLKIHRREVHEEGSFACFVCNQHFKTHKELKQHIKKRCKTTHGNTTSSIVHKHNEDILEEDEHKCPICPKITNNQVSLINHINTKHKATQDKCDSCGQEFENKENLIKHIVEHHTVKGTQVIPRHICSVCNVEVHGDEDKISHIC